MKTWIQMKLTSRNSGIYDIQHKNLKKIEGRKGGKNRREKKIMTS